MKVRAGRNLVRAAAALAVFALAAFFWPPVAWLLAAATCACGVLAAWDGRELKIQLGRMQVSRALPAAGGRNLPFQVELHVSNDGSSPAAGELRDQAPAAAIPQFETHAFELAAGQTTAFATRYRIPVRGAHEFGPVWLRLVGRLGLLEAQEPRPALGRVKVLPEGYYSSESLEHDQRAELMLLDKVSRVRQTGAGTEFEMLSEFRPGDDPRRIDWRTSVRCRRRVVRRFQIERHRDVMVIIDCGRLMGADAGKGNKLDCAVDSALMLCRTALESGDRCGLALFDNQVLGYLPPVSGLRSMRGLTESVYSVQSRWRESDFGLMFATLQSRQSKRSLMVILSDIVDAETSARFRTSLATLAQRHLVLFAGLQTPLLREILAEPVSSVLEGSRKAVTFRLLREREAALHSLQRSGVQVLDVEPSQLTVPLINRFIELRRRNVL